MERLVWSRPLKILWVYEIFLAAFDPTHRQRRTCEPKLVFRLLPDLDFAASSLSLISHPPLQGSLALGNCALLQGPGTRIGVLQVQSSLYGMAQEMHRLRSLQLLHTL